MILLLVSLGCPIPCKDCADAGPPPPTDTGPTTVSEPGDPRCPPIAPADFAAHGVVTQDWSSGTGSASLEQYAGYGWTGYDGVTYDVWATPGWEAVRFELDVPSCVYGIDAIYGKLPRNLKDVTIGLYTDFGSNGMDFYPDLPLWTGEQALDATAEGGWVAWEVPPLWVDGPALIYGANYRNGTKGPAWLLDDTFAGDGYCAGWDDCHSAVNYPEADAGSYDNGTTFPWATDFVVRLHYKPMVEVTDGERWFHAVPGLAASANVSWGDYDDDGDDDLMTNGPTLYRNDGGTFTNVTAESAVAASGVYAAGGVWGDYDNDGCLDFFGIGAQDLLLHNQCDGTFTDVTAASGITDFQDERSCLGSGDPEFSPTAGAAWTDFDNDGRLDLVQANFLCFDTYTYYPDKFWHNLGDGLFEPWGSEHGFTHDDLAGRGAETADFDGDGDLEVAIVNYVLQPNLFYDNLGGGSFDEIAATNTFQGLGTTVGALNRYYGHSIGLKVGDLDNDLDLDVVVGNLAHPRFYSFSNKTQVLLSDGGGRFADVALERGLVYQETHSNPTLLDIENDGDLDLFITEVYDGRPTDVYTNDGAATFSPARLYAGITTENGWGSATADYDRDGDQDYLAYTLFRNDAASGHWVELRLVGDVASNRAAIGAVAWVTAGGRTWMRSVSGGNGTGCQDSQTLHFGLGDASTVDAVQVWFPGGSTVSYTGVTADAAWRLTESGAVSPL